MSGSEASLLRIAVTCGEPAGIGAEVALKALREGAPEGVAPVLVGPRGVWEAAGRVAGVEAVAWDIYDPFGPILPDWAWGTPTARSGRVAADAVEIATAECLHGACDALVTAPLTKEGLHASGRTFPGHTEYLESLCLAAGRQARATMMLAGERLRVFLVTTHAPLAKVPALITREAVLATVEAAHRGLRDDLGFPAPRIAVTGLNPHAGEGGVLGAEERDVIAPAVAQARSQGIDAVGPLPADSVVGRSYAGEFDAVVTMYHDQGLPALKLVHFWDGVNVTFGLPFVRTSPDHGTAFEIAGRGTARAESFAAALRWAAQMARRRIAARQGQGSRTPADDGSLRPREGF